MQTKSNGSLEQLMDGWREARMEAELTDLVGDQGFAQSLIEVTYNLDVTYLKQLRQLIDLLSEPVDLVGPPQNV